MSSPDSAPSDLPSPSDFLGPSFSNDSTSQVASPPSPPPSSDSSPPAPLITDAQSPSPLPASNEPPTPPSPAPAPQPPPPPPLPAPAPQSPLLLPPPPPPPSPSPSPPPTAAPAPQPPPPPPPSPPPQPPSPSPSSNSPLPALPHPSPSPQGAPPTLTSSLPLHPAPPKVKKPPPPPSSSHNLASPPHSSSSHVPGGLVTGVAIGSVAVVAIFGLLWVLFARRKRRRDPYGIEGYYLPREAFSDSAAVSGRMSYPPSGEQFPAKHSLPPIEAVPLPSMSNSAGFSSTPLQPLSTGGSGGVRPDSSGPANSFALLSSDIVLDSMTSAFTYEELSMATDGFSNLNLLGQGGFGYVHKGFLPTGKIIAVKSLKAGSGQGDREFQAEVETISRVHHKHLVSLVGYCVTGPQKLLVYEFVANKTLEFHLHGKGQPVMDWATRLKVAVGAAKGLAYLHEDCHPKIIHRDIKAANILLDFKFEAKVADFGLAKFTSDINTHISTRVMGTFGYLAPEYASSGKLTEKSDVFSFGVVLLELVRGRRPVDHSPHSRIEDSLVDWARPLLSKAMQQGNFDALVDPRLKSNYNYEEMGCMITCAASCVRHSARRRPQMNQVVRALEGNLPLSHLNDGVKPGFSLLQGSTDIDNDQHKEELSSLGRTALSNKYSSSEFGRRTSEFSGYSK